MLTSWCFVLSVDLTDHRVCVSAQSEDQSVQKEGGIQFSQSLDKLHSSCDFENFFRRGQFAPQNLRSFFWLPCLFGHASFVCPRQAPLFKPIYLLHFIKVYRYYRGMMLVPSKILKLRGMQSGRVFRKIRWSSGGRFSVIPVHFRNHHLAGRLRGTSCNRGRNPGMTKNGRQSRRRLHLLRN